MPRYYFNVHDGRDIVDDVGTELDSDDSARIEAIRTSGEMLRDHNMSGFWTGEEWAMDVVDQAGRRVATLRFSGQIH